MGGEIARLDESGEVTPLGAIQSEVPYAHCAVAAAHEGEEIVVHESIAAHRVRERQYSGSSPVNRWREALLVEPSSSHQSGDRAAHTRPGDRRPPAQSPPREPTPDPNRTPGSRTMSKSVAKAPAHPTHCRHNRGIMRFHLSHPDPATAFATDLDNRRSFRPSTARDPRPSTSPSAPAPVTAPTTGRCGRRTLAARPSLGRPQAGERG